MYLLLTIFSGGLFLIDLVLLAIAGWLFYQAYNEGKRNAEPFYVRPKAIMAAVVVALWIVSITLRAFDI